MNWLKLADGGYFNVDSGALLSVQRHEHPDHRAYAHINIAYFATGLTPFVAAEGFQSTEDAQSALDRYMQRIGFDEIGKEETP